MSKNHTIYQIDQSGKIEHTNKHTVIAYSNGTKYAVLIPARLKRQIQEVFRTHGFTKLFTYYFFAVGVFYILSNLKQKVDVIIDLEYPGRDITIKNFIVMFLTAHQKPLHHIMFGRIGNRPPAHYAAKDVFDKKVLPNKILKLEDIIEALKKTDGRLRECLPTLVDVQTRSMNKIYQKTKKKTTAKKGWRSRSSRENP